jgi:UDP-N-acetylglucosamine 2-epimerase (non-hydrolysing)
LAVAHVEAGLRTGDRAEPFPEELNRVMIARTAALHFAPTVGAARNLTREGVAESSVHVVGNTGIDALFWVCDRLARGKLQGLPSPVLHGWRRMVLVTAHRRENIGAGLTGICSAIRRLAARGDCELVFPVHPNPHVRAATMAELSEVRHVHLLEPLEYVPFVDLMRRAEMILTDSGGIQEEAPALGKPVLVLRDKTERPEAVACGAAKLVGTCPETICREAARILDNCAARRTMTAGHSPYGDGYAARRIAELTRDYLEGCGLLRGSCAQLAASGAA